MFSTISVALLALLGSLGASGAVGMGGIVLADDPVDPSYLSALEWRFIGPFRGGRVPAVAGDASDPLVFYLGTDPGGV